jgi:hypothetical protein
LGIVVGEQDPLAFPTRISELLTPLVDEVQELGEQHLWSCEDGELSRIVLMTEVLKTKSYAQISKSQIYFKKR